MERKIESCTTLRWSDWKRAYCWVKPTTQEVTQKKTRFIQWISTFFLFIFYLLVYPVLNSLHLSVIYSSIKLGFPSRFYFYLSLLVGYNSKNQTSGESKGVIDKQLKTKKENEQMHGNNKEMPQDYALIWIPKDPSSCNRRTQTMKRLETRGLEMTQEDSCI